MLWFKNSKIKNCSKNSQFNKNKNSMKIQKIFLKSMVLFLALSAIFGIFSVLTGVFDKFLAMILITTFSLGVYSLTGLCCAPMLNRPELRALGICGIAASILGGGFVIVTNLLLFYLSDHVEDGVFILIGRFLFDHCHCHCTYFTSNEN